MLVTEPFVDMDKPSFPNGVVGRRLHPVTLNLMLWLTLILTQYEGAGVRCAIPLRRPGRIHRKAALRLPSVVSGVLRACPGGSHRYLTREASAAAGE